MKHLLDSLLPFVMIGMLIVAFAFGIMLLAYLFLFGVIVGLVLFVVQWIRNTFFASPKNNTPTKPQETKSGRVIDADEWKEL